MENKKKETACVKATIADAVIAKLYAAFYAALYNNKSTADAEAQLATLLKQYPTDCCLLAIQANKRDMCKIDALFFKGGACLPHEVEHKYPCDKKSSTNIFVKLLLLHFTILKSIFSIFK